MPWCGPSGGEKRPQMKKIRILELQNPFRNPIFSDWLDLNFNLVSEVPQTLTCSWFALVLMLHWPGVPCCVIHAAVTRHQFHTLHDDEVLRVAPVPHPDCSSCHAPRSDLCS